MMFCLPLKRILALSLIGLGALFLQAPKAQAYDMDCKVILCIAGGFPAGCADAYAYMLDRITRFPNPLPPFGFCAMSDGSEYKAHTVDYRYLTTRPDAYDCPADKQLYHGQHEYDDGDLGPETAFCYSHATTHFVRVGDDHQWQTTYHDQSEAERVKFELNITVEPGTNSEYRSPLYRLNWTTGYTSQRPL